ncbi:MAG TPA: DUF4190 domain-containing protein, partial [Verrucomicrobiae bacterium]|nr:DUF4190 domain-containing protein [Verrucomicrobiae bacterium]
AGQYRKTNPWALWGLICGIVSVVFCWCCCFNIPLGVLGLIFSLIGLSEINEFPNIYEGRALAIAGIVVSGVALLLALFVLLANAAGGNFHTYHWHYPRY